MKDKLCYLVGSFKGGGGDVQVSFLPEHPENCGTCAVGLWIGSGRHGDGKFMSPESALKFNYYHVPIGSRSISQGFDKKNGLEFLCQSAQCGWFLDFVKSLTNGKSSPDDFLKEYMKHNDGRVPRSDSRWYSFQ